MALGAQTLTITINGAAKVLKKVNPADKSAEYYLWDTLGDYRVFIRNTTEKVMKDGRAFDRHNVEFIHTVFATLTTPEMVNTVYVTIRNLRSDDRTKVLNDAIGVLAFAGTSANITDMLDFVS